MVSTSASQEKDMQAVAQCAENTHDWGAWIGAREPDFGVVFFMVRTCQVCEHQEIENLAATRASGGPVKLCPPGTIKLNRFNRITNSKASDVTNV